MNKSKSVSDDSRNKRFEDQVKAVKNQLMNFVEEECPNKMKKNRAHSEFKHQKSQGAGAQLGVQMSK
jgi:hypothetical protein